ncbi:putative nucleic acid-binding protein [Thiorhodovibrio frisius]|uniref:Putative nucleic acid-binding protein n=1 Tax=Thiorhodovibrio frisius TaxID=631362 RepID=H8YWK9_9GAMM|nr:putative nucleic acid-binding protein [Thiorhodovibrio frisius]EIC22835.1 putative nucleic acid-binding protein [Thiorhodovibrio frisius]WPL22908.1 hypothetical protein Thiofri_03086 [Thiorhodovibrio frisius]
MIVSNTTPLSCLLKIGQAELLRRLYDRLVIPEEVAAELDQAGPVHQDWREQLHFVQIIPTDVRDPVLTLLTAEIDPGEAAAIALARRIGSELLIMDDQAGRRFAQRVGLTVTGTVGVVMAATESGLINDPFSLLEDLRSRGGLWLSDGFLQKMHASWSGS